MVRVRPRILEQAEEINLPLSPFNGIKDFDESWPIFIDEEEEGVKSLKDLCLAAVNKDSPSVLVKPSSVEPKFLNSNFEN